jgi:hypothetical protein
MKKHVMGTKTHEEFMKSAGLTAKTVPGRISEMPA